jgi:hypothetical protein
MVPIMPVIVSMVVVMIVVTVIVRLALVVVATGMFRAHHDGDLRLRFRRNQSEQPQDGQDQQKELFHILLL